jgi:phage FluMu gp28-like protein
MEPVFFPYQMRWLMDRSKVKIAEKSRRIGLTWAEAYGCVEKAALRKSDGGMNCFYCGYNKELALEFMLTCAEWARTLSLAFGGIVEGVADRKTGKIRRQRSSGSKVLNSERDILVYMIRFASGFRIVALSSRPANLRGKQGHVVIDEAAFHEDLPELLKAAFALTMWNGSISIISTHNGVDNDFNKLCEDVKLGKKPYSSHKITFADAIAEGFYKRVCKVTRQPWSAEAEQKYVDEIRAIYGEGAAEELDVIPARSGGQFMSRALVESCMTLQASEGAVLRISLEDGDGEAWLARCRARVESWLASEVMPRVARLQVNLDHFFGVDFGRVANLTVIAIGELAQDLTRVVPIIIELENCPFALQGLVMETVIRANKPGRVGLSRLRGGKVDNGGLGREQAEKLVMRFGPIVEAVDFNDKWYGDHMPPMKALFEDGAVALPKDADVLNDLTSIVRINGVPKLPKGTTKSTGKQKRHGDAAIALALLLAGFGGAGVSTYSGSREYTRRIASGRG